MVNGVICDMSSPKPDCVRITCSMTCSQIISDVVLFPTRTVSTNFLQCHLGNTQLSWRRWIYWQEWSWARTRSKDKCQCVILKIKLVERKRATNNLLQEELFGPLEKYFFIFFILAQNPGICQGKFWIMWSQEAFSEQRKINPAQKDFLRLGGKKRPGVELIAQLIAGYKSVIFG